MGKIVSIHQPSYWPWFGLLDKIAKSDVFVILDNVQVNKDAYQRRNVFLAEGKTKFLTIPIEYNLGVKINEAKIRDVDFSRKHLETLRNWYLKAPFYKEIMQMIRPVYEKQYSWLSEIVNETMRKSLELFGLDVELFFASEMHVEGTKGNLVLNICNMLSAEKYLSGKGALEYMQESDYRSFETSGIGIEFQQFIHPEYAQINTDTFVAGLGCLDYLFNCGLDEAKHLFKIKR